MFYYVYHRLTNVQVAKVTNTALLNKYPPSSYEVVLMH